jgi:excisionase family DNA binding protein
MLTVFLLDVIMHNFKRWLLLKLAELNWLSSFEPDPLAWEHAGLVVDEAGNRAARLGLTDLYERSLDLGWSVTTHKAVGFLAACLAGLPKATSGDMLTVTEAAKLLGTNRGKILGWVNSGRLKAANVAKGAGGRPRYRVARTDLDLFLASRTRQPVTRPARRRRPADDDVIRYFPES